MSKSRRHDSIFQGVTGTDAVGIHVCPNGKSTVAILRPMGEIVMIPMDIMHDVIELERLTCHILTLSEDTRGRYGSHRQVL